VWPVGAVTEEVSALPAPDEQNSQRTERARAEMLRRAAERAADSPKELARVARIYKVALARGQITRDGDLVEEQAS
jgi:hypothetical protein